MFGQSNTPFGSPPGGGGFGATNTAPAFGSPAPAPFGAPSSGFGGASTAFGSPAPAPTGFGATNTFGAAPSTGFGGGGFGAPAPAPTGFGGGGFGSSNTASPFGAPAPAPTGGLFGSAPAPSGGLFGASAPTNTGFGGTTSTFGGFGASTAGGFGAPSQPSAFGAPAPAPAPSTGLFGAPAPAPPAFGASAGGFGSTSAFGSPAPAPGGSLFGSPPAAAPGLFGAAPAAAAPGGGGTRTTPFQATSRQDGTSTIMMQSISAMPAYESKSFEELRFEDYSQGNRGSSSAPVGGSTFGFGAAPAPAGGLFGGAAPAPAPFGAAAGGGFGAPAPAPFGAPAATPFGAPAPGGFGAPAPAPFGAPAPAPFGAQAPAPGFGGGAFGKAPATGLFGAPAPAAGLFGSSPAPAPAFGAAPASGGLFGSAPAPAPPGGLFGASAPAPGGLFGSPAPAPAFGAAPTPAPGGLFGAPAPAPGGLFGSSAPAPAFGAPAPGSSLFGAPAPSGGLFGNRSPATSLFGAPAPAPGMFGAPAPTQPTSLFGAPASPAAAPTALPPVGTIIPPAANDVLAHQLAALEKKREEIEKLDVWRGESSTSAIAMPANNPEPIPVLPTTSSFKSYRASPRSTAKVRPRGFGSPFPSTSNSIAQSPMDSFARSRPLMSPDSYAVSSIKHLVVNPESQTPKPKVRLRLTNSPATAEAGASTGALPVPAERVEQSVDAMKKSPDSTEQASIQVYTRGTPTSVGKESNGSPYWRETSSQKTPTNLESKDLTSPGLSYYQKIVGSPDASESKAEETENSSEPSYLPKLSKPGYVVTPSLDAMSKLSEASLATLSGFSVERSPFGKVEWDGEVDVRNADLDKVVEIKQNDVSVYMKDEEKGTKPKVGSKLNRPAVITFFNVFPKNGGASADAATKESFRKKIAKSTAKMDAELLSYDDEIGEWKIRVLHFSRYGLDDSDDDDEVGEPQVFSPEGDRSTGRWDDEMEDTDAAVVSDAEMSENNESRFVRETSAAYAVLFEAARDQPKSPSSPIVENDAELEGQLFNEVEYSDGWDAKSSWEDVGVEDYDWAVSAGGISSRIASKFFGGRTVPNSNDFGRRMGRSFRVGWSPDGSFVKLGAPKNGSPVLTFDRPVFSKSDSKGSGVEYLETHKEKATRKEASLAGPSPRFYLPLSLRNSGDQSSDNALYEALESYASLFSTSSKESDLIIPRAFALLASLLDGADANIEIEDGPKDGSHRFMNSRRREAVRRMFAEACKRDVEKDILIAKQSSDIHSAAFAALSGGDVEKASNLAADMGQLNLAVLLACGFTGGSEILDQVKMSLENPLASSSTIPETLLRIYRLLGGDLEGERKLVKRNASHLDWKRHFLLRLVFDKSVRHLDTEVADVVRQYMVDIPSGFAPPPSPQYMASVDRFATGEQCLLFRILRLTMQPQELSSLEVIDPRGFHTNIHDFVGSFHLASALSAMGICSPLSEIDEARLIDGYAAQLVSQGKWEWAVYVSLCSLNPGKVATSTWKLQRAKDLVLRHFTPGDPLAAERQKVLLEDIGVPEEWLDEALANWHSCGNNPFPYIQHLAMYSPLEASKVVDEAILPNLLFMSKVDLRKGLLLLESFGSYLSPMGSAVYNLFELSKDIRVLVAADRKEIDENLPSMFEIGKDIEKTLRACRAECDHKADRTPVRKWYTYESVPLSSMLAEAWDHLMFLKLQMKALEAGIRLSSEITSKRLTAQMAFMGLDESYVKFINETDVMRGLR